MKRIYNISDVPSPKLALLKKARSPKTFRVGTEMVEPGKFVDVPDVFQIRTIAGLLEDEVLSVGGLPQWYQDHKKAERVASKPAIIPPAPKEEKSKTEFISFDDEVTKTEVKTPKPRQKKAKKSS